MVSKASVEKKRGWVRVRNVMDSGCGVSVAPPEMCSTCPITESEGGVVDRS